MAATLDDIQERLEKLESDVALLGEQVNQLLVPQGSLSPTITFVDKEKLRPIVDKVFEAMGIHGEPIGAEELQKMVAACGVKPEDNIFSRGIIEMREE
ncbi:hypothetical protein HYR99_41100 [Candidatus Poribacteria bacterium]|nr:hypothetical protein [Candidatus Poribacteria bacterium]